MTTLSQAINVPLFDVGGANDVVRDELRAAFDRVVDSAHFSSGQEVAAFEGALSGVVDTRHVVAVASGTAALHLALMAAGVGRGDEVILPTNSFFATAEAVLAVGATPMFADVDEETALINVKSVEALVSGRTAAVIAVHLYGQPADMDRLRAISNRYGLFLLEDAAQALGSVWRDRPVGCLGDAAAFSFYPTKNLGALGEGGAVSTNDHALAQRVSRLRNHGDASKNVHLEAGFNERMQELQAAFLTVKLRHLGVATTSRRQAVETYRSLLTSVPSARPFVMAPGAEPAPHLFVVKVPRRDEVLSALQRAGIGAGVHYPTPIHLQPACRHLGVKQGQLPVAERLAGSILSLPLYPGLRDEQIRWCVTALGAALGEGQ